MFSIDLVTLDRVEAQERQVSPLGDRWTLGLKLTRRPGLRVPEMLRYDMDCGGAHP